VEEVRRTKLLEAVLQGARSGVNGTPTRTRSWLFINGVRYEGPTGPEGEGELRAAIEKQCFEAELRKDGE